MGSDLRAQLQSTLGAAYSLERELGGGGMSRVFVAEETALGRTVVVKVLSPELGAGVDLDRFKREIQLAARLQHPHIVPVLAAGETNGTPYYTMPFVDGESLRARLVRTGPLPVADAVAILRDVAKALVYAHARGLVHRDVKPDNVLLSGGSAVVTDFGIAKAIAASRTDGGSPHHSATLTRAGAVLGTPAYMAPEQAAGDPDTDHRADIYAFGILAYELLAGQPPFHGRSTQRLLAAHMAEAPVPIQQLRAEVPDALAALIARCIEKDPAARPRSAAELVAALDAVPSGAGTGVQSLSTLAGGGAGLRQALAVYAAAFLAVALVTRLAIERIGLPDWVFPGALIVMALGLPVILLTGYAHYAARRTVAATHEGTPVGGTVPTRGVASLAMKAQPHLTWRRAAAGGAWAVGIFALAVAGYMAMRALGIGPAGSLIGAGALDTRDRILVADFRASGDTSLGPVVTLALETDLAQSSAVQVVSRQNTQEILALMQRPRGAVLDLPLALEVAERGRIKAVLHGEVNRVGGHYVLTARLVSIDGRALASFRETAASLDDMIPAIDRLSRRVRERIGESLRDVRATPPLFRVTTHSLDALRKFTQAVRAISAGDEMRGIALFEEAVAIDSTFAEAHRSLGTWMNNFGLRPFQASLHLRKAYEHRDRLPPMERLMIAGSYYQSPAGGNDFARALQSFLEVLELDSLNNAAVNNVALNYLRIGDPANGAKYYERLLRDSMAAAVSVYNAAFPLFALGRHDEARRVLTEAQAKFPQNQRAFAFPALYWAALGAHDSVSSIMLRWRAARPRDQLMLAISADYLGDLATLRGQLREMRRYRREQAQAEQARGNVAGATEALIAQAQAEALLGIPQSDVIAMLDSLPGFPGLDSLEAVERQYVLMALTHAMAGRSARARELLARERAEVPDSGWRASRAWIERAVLGWIALSEGRPADAVPELRAAHTSNCTFCSLPSLALAHDRAGQPDSAIAVMERYLGTRAMGRFNVTDWLFLAGVHKRLGELYDARGDSARAVTHYEKFVELWKDADPELQPLVADVRRRLARLSRRDLP